MLAIYRGEDTEFADAEPFTVKIDTDLDLTGCTGKLYFGSVIKEFDAEEMASKELALSFNASDTADMFPGQAYATLKAYDAEGRESVLKRFIIDVRMRSGSGEKIDAVEAGRLLHIFSSLRDFCNSIDLESSESEDTLLEQFFAVVRMRDEFSPLSNSQMYYIKPDAFKEFWEGYNKLDAVAHLKIEEISVATQEIIGQLIALFRGTTLCNPSNVTFSLICALNEKSSEILEICSELETKNCSIGNH